MIHYNDYDLGHLNEYDKILKALNCQIIEDEDVWKIAKDSEDVPSFENILLDLTLNSIQSKLKQDTNLNVSYSVNARDTHLFINNTQINALQDFKQIYNCDYEN